MSRLRLYWPDRSGSCTRSQADDSEPATLPFQPVNRLKPPETTDPLTRARVIHRNRLCPECGHPVVEPLVLGDVIRGRSNAPIPGTGTLVGFHCHGCQSEWPIQSYGFAFPSDTVYAANTLRLARDA